MRTLFRRLGALVLLLLIAATLKGVFEVYQKAKGSRALRGEAEAQLSDIQKREIELRSDVAHLKTDRGLEEELRERFDLSKDGEGVVVIIDPADSPPEPQPTPFQRFKSWFSW